MCAVHIARYLLLFSQVVFRFKMDCTVLLVKELSLSCWSQSTGLKRAYLAENRSLDWKHKL
jgi:hypothetical protein